MSDRHGSSMDSRPEMSVAGCSDEPREVTDGEYAARGESGKYAARVESGEPANASSGTARTGGSCSARESRHR
jgi:hypothetical protein